MSVNTNETDTDEIDIEPVYSVVSVKKTQPPNEMAEGDWYRYEITGKNSTIVGSMQGTLQQVSEHAENVAQDLNARDDVRKGGLWSSRTRQ